MLARSPHVHPPGADPRAAAAPRLTAAPDAGTSPPPGWEAALELGFERREARTVLARRSHRGPLLVQRPFYPEGPGVCHVVVLHPPGGVVGGDRLRVEASVGPGAHALLTTPAATKLYRSAGPQAELHTTLRVAEGATLEWLPQETIAFAGARARQHTRVELAAGARLLGWEVLCLGRPAAGEAFARGEVRHALEVWRAGRPLLSEHGRYGGGGALLAAPWGLGGWPVLATLLAVRPGGGLAGLWQGAAPREQAAGALGPAGVTELNGVLVGRCLAPHADAARRWLLAAWQALRPALTGAAPCPPRIWNT
jgi:urease accessory protein